MSFVGTFTVSSLVSIFASFFRSILEFSEAGKSVFFVLTSFKNRLWVFLEKLSKITPKIVHFWYLFVVNLICSKKVS